MRRALPALALAACGPVNRASPVGDLVFDLASAHLTVDPGTFGADDLLTITLSSLPASCDAERAFRDGTVDAETPEAIAAVWADTYPPAFTEIELGARVPGGTWPARGAAWTGLAWDAFPEQNNVVFGVLTQHLALRDADWWAGEVDDPDAVERVFYTDGGLVKWGGVSPQVRVSGRFVTGVVDDAGSAIGDTEIRFDATICGL